MNRSEFIKKTMQGKILDVGCAGKDGRGSSLHEFIYNEDVHGLDLTDCPDMKNFTKGDAMDMPFEDRTFNTVIAGEVIEHLEDQGAFMAEAKRVMKSGGLLIITTPNRKSWLNRILGNYYVLGHIDGHINLLTVPDVKFLVSKYFRIREFFCLPYDSDTTKSLHPNWFWLRRLVHKFIPQSLQENIIIVAEK